ncbi:MAG: transposase [Candidatus Vecturithrix sp.]|jgi:hypothetical protein|nr:transposase [Candidatus Vecturithrix sp.]
MGRIRLHVALDCSACSLETFLLHHVAAGSRTATDGWQCYDIAASALYAHEKTNLRRSKDYEHLYGVHLVTSLLNRIIQRTYQWRFDPRYLHNYLDEYVFRFNRRKSCSVGKVYMRLVQQVVRSTKITWQNIPWGLDPLSEFFATKAS